MGRYRRPRATEHNRVARRVTSYDIVHNSVKVESARREEGGACEGRPIFSSR